MRTFFKTISVSASILFLSIILNSCTNLNQKSYSASIAGPVEKSLAQNDLKFLLDAYNFNLYNCAVANEAVIRSTSTESTKLAESLLAASTKVKSAIANMAKAYDVELQQDISADQKTTWTELVKHKGWEFDKAFAAITEDNLQATNNLYSTAINSVKDEQLKQIAVTGLTDLKQETDLLFAQQEKIKQRIGNHEAAIEALSDR